MRVALIRHAAPAIAAGICYGSSDVPLAPGTGAALRGLARALTDFPPGPVWCSPARRCRATAEAVAGGRAILEDGRLREMDFGAWEGLRWDDVPRTALDQWAADPWDFAPPEGESARAVTARVASFHAMLREAGADCVVVAHGGPLKVLASLLAGTAPDVLAPAPPFASLRVVGEEVAAMDPHDLQRFVAAQEDVFDQVLRELLAGRKRTHWMWFVFPQIAGLGHSDMARRYAIASRAEAAAYQGHPVLGPRLRQCTDLMLRIADASARDILGAPDDMKFRSCMTLFAAVAPGEPRFTAALERFFAGAADQQTLARL